ncbi:MAG TPA: TetR/AcrR family transcriptional regulator [Flavisolibacter sp.]|nr:TetR/AcrR family transcriptional regulator [Flavisolibacter sp.]
MDKRNHLIETALALFVENGFHGTATARIAKEAGVANGTLFQYFKTKEELILAVFVSVKGELAAFLAADKTTGGVKEVMMAQYSGSIKWCLKHVAKYRYIQQFYSSPYIHLMDQAELRRYIEPHLQLVEEGIRTKAIKALDIDLVYQLFSTQTFGIVQYLINNKGKKQKEVIETTFQMLWDMIKIK